MILTISASPFDPCTLTATDELALTFVAGCEDAIANAGWDMTLCAGNEVGLLGSAQNAAGVLWQTSGDGYFENAYEPETIYFPGEEDFTNEGVTLSLTAFAMLNCQNDTNSIEITLVQPPLVNPGDDIVICEGTDSVEVCAEVSNYLSIEWTTSGDGLFSQPEMPCTSYQPGIQDIMNANVTLTITVCGGVCQQVSDHLTLTINPAPIVFAGADASICTGEYFLTDNAFADNYENLLWTTSGDGYFENPDQLETTYHPGQSDYQNGSVQICLTAEPLKSCEALENCFTLTLLPNATAFAGDDISICQSEIAILSATATNHSSIHWTTGGDGYFENPSSLSTTYHPGIQDIASGSVQLSLSAIAANGCSDAVSSLMVSIEKSPAVNAGENQTICETATANLVATASNFSSIKWETNGDGTFGNSTQLITSYTPGPADKLSGTVILTITANPVNLCANVVDQITLAFQPVPAAFAGDDLVACKTTEAISLQGSAQNYSSILWTTLGDGWFENPSSLVAMYHPGSNDKNAGLINVCLNAVGLSGCETAQDFLTITLQNAVAVSAGNDATICEGADFQLYGWAENYSSIQWTTSGDGTFDNENMLNPIYSPGINDLASGSVYLCLSAQGLNGCDAADHCMQLIIQPLPVAIAGDNQPVCIGGPVNLSGVIFNSNLATWSSSGDGNFVNTNDPTTQYIPGIEDLASGSVVLCLTASGLFGCDENTGCLTITFVATPEVFAGTDATISKNENYQLSDATKEHCEAILWSTSGLGYFNDSTLLHPTYTPHLEDISYQSVILTITGFPLNPCQVTASDNMTLTITYECLDAIADAGSDGSVCDGNAFQVSSASARFTNNVLWSTDGDGTFDNPESIDPVYAPGSNDRANGYVTLCLKAIANADCNDDEDCMTLTIQKLPEVYAGADRVVNIDPVCFTDAWAENYSIVQWFTTNGMGYFEVDTVVKACYVPSYNDILQDQILLKLVGYSKNPCFVSVEDEVGVKFYDGCLDAVAHAGEDITACAAGGIPVAGNAENYVSTFWMSSGDGEFGDFSALETVYYPGSSDIAAGFVNVSFTAVAAPPCISSTDNLTIHILPSSTANAGPDQTICETSAYIILSASALGHTSLLWTTSGDGFFIFNNYVSPFYYPGDGDRETGGATLSLTTYSALCPPVTDQMELTIVPKPELTMNDYSICRGEVYYTNDVVAENYEQLFWTTDGDGYFDAPDELITGYHPGTSDIQNGFAVLKLNLTGQIPCANSGKSMTLTIFPDALANAGEDVTICESGNVSLSGFAEYHNGIVWETSGDGTFENANEPATTYFPGGSDVNAGFVNLTLTAFSAHGCMNASSTIAVTFEKSPVVSAGSDQLICEGNQVFLSGSAQYHSSVLWSTEGDGTFTVNDQLETIYQPGEDDILNGEVSICFEAFAAEYCQSVTSCLEIHIQPQTVVSAGNDATICENGNYQLNALAANYSAISWISSGDGAFNNFLELNPVYTPGEADLTKGYSELCLTIAPVNPCTVSATDCMVLNFDPIPQVNAGDDITICENSTALFAGQILDGCDFYWQTDGDGIFENESTLTPSYTPGTADLENEAVTICLIVHGCGSCDQTVMDCLEITFGKLPMVSAGNDGTVCSNGVFSLNQSIVTDYSSVLWSSDGDGIFENNTQVNTTYTPGANDISTGQADLCLIAEPLSPCVVASTDCLMLQVIHAPVADAGDDMTVCASSAFADLYGYCAHHTDFVWSRIGTGSFSNPEIINPKYFFSTTDKTLGSVKIILKAYNPYCGWVSDTLLITITPVTTVNAGADASICNDEAFLTSAATVSHSSSVYWTTSGDGYFDSPESLVTIYHPGTEDIENGTAELCLHSVAISPCANKNDCMILTVMPPATVYAGEDQVICEINSASLIATANHFSTVQWQSSGDGSFDDDNAISAIYNPGVQDIASGSVVLTIVAFSDTGCGDAGDELVLQFVPSTTVYAGADVVICENGAADLNAEAENHTSVLWTTQGDGTFEDATALSTQYIPGGEDIESGEVKLWLTAYSSGICQSASDCLEVTIILLPNAIAGDDATICQSDSYMLQGLTGYSTGAEWSSAGDGTFDNPALLHATYSPGPADISVGFATLTLTAFGLEGCSNDSDETVIYLNPPAQVFAGINQLICADEIVELNASASNYSGLKWQTSGDGSFGDDHSLQTTYTPGFGDISQGFVTLCVAADGFTGCPTVSSCVDISISRLPVVIAGENDSICENGAVVLYGVADNCMSVLWTTEGDGYFTTPESVYSHYIPGQLDLANGYVELCLEGNGFTPCGSESDCLVISFVKLPAVFAGEDATIGKYDSFTPQNSLAENYSSVLWMTSGSGTFDNPNTLATVYTPSFADVESVEVIITLTAQPLNPCQIDASDDLILTIYYSCLDAIVNSGDDAAICLGDEFSIAGTNGKYYSGLLWETSGDGFYDDNTALNPVYTPGPWDEFNGNVTLCVTAFGFEDCADDSDCLSLTIQKPPKAFAGHNNTVLFPEEGGYQFSSAWAENYNDIQWFTTDGMGSFDDETVVNPQYFPSFLELSYEFVTFSMACSPVNPCSVSDESFVGIKFLLEGNNASVEIPETEIYFCESDTAIQLNATGTLYSAIEWSTTGDGYFRYCNTLSPKYIPGANDKSGNVFTLSVIAYGFADYESATDQVQVSLQLSPEVMAGEDQTVCPDGYILINDALAENVESVVWSSAGDGYFTNDEQLITEYNPGPVDLSTGWVTLSVTGIPSAECYEPVSSSRLITFDLPVIVSDISDSYVLYGSSFELTILANNATGYQWFGPQGIIEGATQYSLIVTNASDSNSGGYYCRISNDCSAIISNTAQITVCEQHQLQIPAGWSGISSWIDPFEPEIETIFANVMDDLILIKSMTGVYSPLLNISILHTWNPQEGYETKFNNSAIVTFIGSENLNNSLVISSGWSYLPVISRCPVSVTSLFAGKPVDIIKEIGGTGVYWPLMGINTIVNLQPGRSYLIRATSSFSLTFPLCQSLKGGTSSVYRPQYSAPWNDLSYTSSTHIIAIDKHAVKDMSHDAIIGAFTTNGLCAGMIQISSNLSALVVFGDDHFTVEMDGFAEDEQLSFRLYDPFSGLISDLEVEFDGQYADNSGKFRTNGISRITGIKNGSIGVDENASAAVHVYPNPTSGEVTISGIIGLATIEVYQTGGLLLLSKSAKYFDNNDLPCISLENYPAGIYYLKIITSKQTEIRKIIRR